MSMANKARWVVAALSLLSLPAGADEATDKRVQALEEEVAKLKGKPAESRKDDGSPIRLTYKKGLQFKSEDGDFTMGIAGYVYENGRFFTQTSPNDNTFYNKETALEFQGTVSKKFLYRLDIVVGPTTSMNDSWVGYQASDAFLLKIGQFKEPFLYDETVGSRARDFAESSIAKRLAPSRSVGVGVSGKLLGKRLGYEAGVFNGTINGSGRNASDTNDDKEWAARLDVAPFLAQKENVLQNLHLAVAGTWAREDAVQPNFGAAGNFTMPDSTTTFLQLNTTARVNQIERRCFSAYWNRGPSKLIGEFASSRLSLERNPNDNQDPTPGIRDKIVSGNTRFDAWYVTGTYVLTGEEPAYNKQIEPKRPFKTGEGGGWGAWEVAGRISRFQAEREPFAQGDVTKGFGVGGLALPQTTGGVGSTTQVDSWILGLNWTPVSNVRIYLDYGENDFGSNYVGTLGADTRHAEKFILIGTQVNF